MSGKRSRRGYIHSGDRPPGPPSESPPAWYDTENLATALVNTRGVVVGTPYLKMLACARVIVDEIDRANRGHITFPGMDELGKPATDLVLIVRQRWLNERTGYEDLTPAARRAIFADLDKLARHIGRRFEALSINVAALNSVLAVTEREMI
jgi:hypothetical protein